MGQSILHFIIPQGEVLRDRNESRYRRKTKKKCFEEDGMSVQRNLRSDGAPQLSSRDSGSLKLQVDGICCPLQQRPNSGRQTLQSSFRRRLESGTPLASRSSMGIKLEMAHEGGAPLGSNGRDPVKQKAKIPTIPSDDQQQVCLEQHGSTRLSRLDLYLPSSVCDDDDEQNAEAEEDCSLGDKTPRMRKQTKQSSSFAYQQRAAVGPHASCDITAETTSHRGRKQIEPVHL